MPDYVEMARAAARRHGIDPDLFVRQIKQESNFNPRAGSSAGARGIAQIVPQYHPGVDPYDPAAALDYAATWMRQLLDQYGGDWATALVHYNGGGGAVQQYRAGRPYGESRAYLGAILGGGGPKVQASVQQEAAAMTGPEALGLLEQAYGKPISVVAIDPEVEVETETDELNFLGDPTGKKIKNKTKQPNRQPTYRYSFPGGAQIDIKASDEAPNQVIKTNTKADSVLYKETPQAQSPAQTERDQIGLEKDRVALETARLALEQARSKQAAALTPEEKRLAEIEVQKAEIGLQQAQIQLERLRNPAAAPPPQRAPRFPEEEELDRLQVLKAQRELMDKRRLAIQGHQEVVTQVQGMLERGEIDPKEADSYVGASRAATEAALRGATPFEEAKERRQAEEGRRSVGRDILTQRLSSGVSLASSLLGAAGNARLEPGKSLGVDLFGVLDQLQGGSDVTPYARSLLMGAGAASTAGPTGPVVNSPPGGFTVVSDPGVSGMRAGLPAGL